MKLRIFAVVSLFIALPALGGEGMWMPQQIPQLASELKQLGLQLDPSQFSDLTGFPMGAVISLGGCTASFVSPEGLAVTNHHCAESSIQYNSSAERDLLTDGFLAKTKEEELPAAPGSRIYVTTNIEDVTAKVTGNIGSKISDLDRYHLIAKRRSELVAECEKEGGVRCTVSSFFEGSQYLRIKQMEVRDVRLVYAPAGGVGNFGGETDNWMWPRHTGDYSFLRAYVGPDGKPADYSKENVPYRPKHFLKVSTEGVDEGDLVLVAGYPGRTFRYRTAGEVRNSQEFTTPTTIRYGKAMIAILEEESRRSKAVEITNAARMRRFANQMKNYEGTMESFNSGEILRHREEREAALAKWLAANPEQGKKYGSALAAVEKLNAQLRATRERDLILDWLDRSSPLLGEAAKIYRLSMERQIKDDLARKEGYQQRDWGRIREATDRTQKSIHLPTDRAGLRYFLIEATKLPATQRISAIDAALARTGEKSAEAQIDKFLDQLYAGTKVGELEARHAMLEETTAQLKARRDTMLDFAAALSHVRMEREKRDLGIDGAMTKVRPLYVEALRAMGNGRLYPDANSTLRVTFGQVRGYRPRDAVAYSPQTTVEGILAKDRGEGEFESPKRLLQQARNDEARKPYIDAEIGTIPVDFLSTVDTTGGNSGSPTFNAKGELVGLLFDGNYESLGSDYLYDREVQRSIHVDMTYVRWVMDAVDGAHNLLREMGLTVYAK